MNQITDTASFALLAGETGFDPIEERLRSNVRATIEAVFEEELASFLGCSVPDDHIDPRRSALFMARWILREVRDGGRAC